MQPPLWEVRPVLQALFRIPRDPPPRLAQPTAWSAHFAHFLSCTLQKEPERRAHANPHPHPHPHPNPNPNS